MVSVYGRNFIDSDFLNCRFGNDSVVSGRWVSSDRVDCKFPYPDKKAVLSKV